ncbi:MAG: hypothetical protein H6825_00180 [Planctomycetes bacterium]|nr:hypothetical protein [Planctomycetota bacterium]
MVEAPERTRVVELERFTVGHVISTSLSVWTRCFVGLCAITALCSIPSVLLTLAGPASVLGAEPDRPQVATTYGWLAITMVMSWLTGAITAAAVLHGVFTGLRGEPMSIGTSLRRGMSVFLPILLANLLVSVIIFLPYLPGAAFMVAIPAVGVVLFIVAIPFSVALALKYYLVSAVIVAEDVGVGASLPRSAALTKRSRWQLLLLLVVVGVIAFVVTMVTQFALPVGTARVVGQIAVQILFGSFGAVITGVAYHELRRKVDGLDDDALATIFA